MLVQKVLVLVVTVSAVILLSCLVWQAPARASHDEEETKGGDSGSVTFRLAGDKGTPFSGTCSVGAKKHDISARVPQRIEYELNGRKLACEIRKQEAQGVELKVLLKAGNTRSIQRSEGGEDTAIRLVYEDGSVSSSTSSSSSQMMSSTSGLSSSAARDTRQRDYNWERFADHIQKKVNSIIEQALP
jgi:hypothetical protein